MEFFWLVQNLRPLYLIHPEKYISHILGHEGENSLMSIFKRKDYASEIVAYHHELMSQTIIGLEIHLTSNGEDHYKEVYNLVMDYVNWLQADESLYN